MKEHCRRTKLEDPAGKMPSAELTMSFAELNRGEPQQVMVANVKVLANASGPRTVHSFFDDEILATYAGDQLVGLEVLSYVPSPTFLPELWKFAEARKDDVLIAAVHTVMALWGSLQSSLTAAHEVELGRRLVRAVDSEVTQRRWARCEREHSTEVLWA